jgi:effector-binding domain-containing protein
MICPRQTVPTLLLVGFSGLVGLFGSLVGPSISLAQDKPPAAQAPTAQAPAPQAPAAQAPAPSDASKPTDPFGEEVTLPGKTIVYFKGNGSWDSAFETITDGFKSVTDVLGKAGIKPAGALMTIYTSTDDNGFQFQAAVPVGDAPKDLAKGNIAIGTSPTGKAYKFVHRGSYDSMDTTYEAITNFLDEKGIDAKEAFVEEYVTDPLTTPEDKLVVDIYVPIK